MHGNRLSTYWLQLCRIMGRWLMLFCLLALFSKIQAQPGLSLELAKPKNYENRTLPSEKSSTTKFHIPKRFYHDLVSRFNYYFNANSRLNEALDRARKVHHDDFTHLLSFYDYTLDETAKGDIDTILYKCTAGILLHDLRSDWVDKLYLLMGKAYLYRKDFDSATLVFQYINYAFAPKDNGYDIPIGSNASNTNGVFTIATRENRSLWKKLMSFPPSRNESFMWQARTYIESDELVEASSLLELIRTDPNFPERLHPQLEELTAYLLYKQQNYGASASHLMQALEQADSRDEKARWEFLAGQMYERANENTQAIQAFEKAIQHTTNPILEVYARMRVVYLSAAGHENALQQNLDELLKMARRDRYAEYRHIIYYAAAELELSRQNYPAAQGLLIKSAAASGSDLEQKQKSFLLLGDMNYQIRHYTEAYRFYDSIQSLLLHDSDRVRVEARKPALKIISHDEETIQLQDSLQLIAAMPEAARDEYLKKLLKQLRRDKNEKDRNASPVSFGNALYVKSNLPGASQANNGSSSFYFQNPASKAQGYAEFISRWGNRPNVDNWQRQSAVTGILNKSTSSTTTGADSSKTGTKSGAMTAEPVSQGSKDPSLADLLKNIPLTPAKMDSSNQLIIHGLLSSAHTFQNALEDYPAAIEMYEALIRRFPASKDVQDALFNLVYCYRKQGMESRSDSALAALKSLFPKGDFTERMIKGTANTGQVQTDPATTAYQQVYDLFLSGEFEKAKDAKAQADKLYGKNFWTPQLLFIESVYYVRQREDSTAINRLEEISKLFPKSPLAEKAGTMIDVLRRRKEIEQYLTNLKLDSTQGDITRRVDLYNPNAVQVTSGKNQDTSSTAPTLLQPLHKELTNLSDTKTIATDRPARKDSSVAAPQNIGIPSQQNLSNNVKVAAPENNTFKFNPSDTQFVVLVLDKVDPIFVSEGRNAFNRFNQQNFADQYINVYLRKLNDRYNLLMMGPFANATQAVTYIDKVRPLTQTRIIPWLTGNKYRFSIISNANMNILVKNQDMDAYQSFLHQLFPDKF